MTSTTIRNIKRELEWRTYINNVFEALPNTLFSFRLMIHNHQQLTQSQFTPNNDIQSKVFTLVMNIQSEVER
jgi:hypothetical protein